MMRKKRVIIYVDGGFCSQIQFFSLGLFFQDRGYDVQYDLGWFKKYGKDLNHKFDRTFVMDRAFPKLKYKIASKFMIYIYKRFFRKHWSETNLPHHLYVKGYYDLRKTSFIQHRDFWINAFNPIDIDTIRPTLCDIEKHESCAVHVRRGDLATYNPAYGTPPTPSYFIKSINLVLKQKPKTVFYFFSDEIDWVQENIIPHLGKNIKYKICNQNGSDKGYLDLYLISHANSIIASHGSFGETGRYMNIHSDLCFISMNNFNKRNDIVSILCPTFNHEKYVSSFLNSLLAQTNPNWELIIVDDCSSDNNIQEIKKYHDSRIKLVSHPFNMGPNCGLNTAFEKSRGQYIAFCASDDILKPDYIENVLNCFANNPGRDVLYCDLQTIDNKNQELNGQILHTSRGTRYEVLKKLFFIGNVITSPGMAVRRNLFQKILPLDIPMSQYQDYQMHINLLLQSDFMIMDKISVLYRKNDMQSGLSAINDTTKMRIHLEENMLMNSFLQITDIKILKNIFGNDLEQFGNISKKTIPFILGRLAMQSHDKYKKIWGYNQIANFINNNKNYALVNKMYNFCYKDFLALAKKFNENQFKLKYIKYKKLFNLLCALTSIIIITFIIILWK